MNERIKELYGNALDKAVPYTWHNLDHVEVEKIMKVFAELIVRECVNKIVMEQDKADRNWSCKNGVHIVWEMLDHFGVD